MEQSFEFGVSTVFFINEDWNIEIVRNLAGSSVRSVEALWAHDYRGQKYGWKEGVAIFPYLRLAAFTTLKDCMVEVFINRNEHPQGLWGNACCPHGFVKAEVLDRDEMKPVADLTLENSVPYFTST